MHHAKENEALNRFKLRVRTYGEPGDSRVFLEVKRKIRGTIVKSRTSVSLSRPGARPDLQPATRDLTFKSVERGRSGFSNSCAWRGKSAHGPVVLIRYTRESYFSRNDRYARVSFDRKLQYQPTARGLLGEGGTGSAMDTPLAQNKHYGSPASSWN